MTRNIFMDFYMNIVFHALFYGIFITPVILFFDLQVVAVLLLMLAVVVYLFLARQLIKPAVFLFIAHIPILAAAWFIAPDVYTFLLYLAMAATMVAFSLFQRFRRTQTFTPEFLIFSPLVLIALALFVGSQGHGHMYFLYAVILIIVCVGGKLHIRMTTVNTSLDVIAQTSVQPVQKILAYDYKVMLILGVIIIGLAIAISTIVIRPVLEAISNISINIDLSVGEDPIDAWEMLPEPPANASDITQLLTSYNPRGPFFLWRVLELFLIFAVLPYIGIKLLIFLYRFIGSFFEKLQAKDTPNFEVTGFEEIKEFIRTPKVKKLRKRGLHNENKVRQLFRDTVVRHIKKGVPIQKSDTPGQMAGKIATDDISGLVEDYWAVRYK